MSLGLGEGHGQEEDGRGQAEDQEWRGRTPACHPSKGPHPDPSPGSVHPPDPRRTPEESGVTWTAWGA